MVISIYPIDLAAQLAMADTKEKFNFESDSPEDAVGEFEGSTAIEYYNSKYEYYFNIICLNEADSVSLESSD